jgi:anaerobic magnesium-protoporphyrin IX monomethyl ester cyclase
MRCCLINPLGTDPQVACSPPLGLAYIAATLEKAGHEVKIVDRVALQYRNPKADLRELDGIAQREIAGFEPELVGIGAVTIQVYDLQRIARLVRRMRNGGNFPIVAGGFHPTAEPSLTLEDYHEIDIVCRGEGEQAMLDLASGMEPGGIPGLSFKREGNLISTEERVPPRDLDLIPRPARHLLDMGFYCRLNDMVLSSVPLRAATVLASRGCAYDCSFCSSKLIYKSSRYHSPGYVLDEVESLAESYPIDAVSFVDSTMLPRRDRLEEICEGLIKRKLNKRLRWGCSLRANLVDEKILALMKEAGCMFVNYGFESGSQRMLDGMNKRVAVADNYRAARLTHDAGILVNSAFIVNMPGETEDDMRATISFLKNNGDRLYSVGLNPLLPLPGSPWYEEFVRDGTLRPSGELWSEIGALPESMRHLRLYTEMPRGRFMELYNEADRVATRNNIRHYIRRNLLRHPVYLLRKAARFLGRRVADAMVSGKYGVAAGIAWEMLGTLARHRVGKAGAWEKPFATLGNRWVEVPATPTVDGRMRTDELLALPDEELLRLWLEARERQTVGDGFATRGWYHLLYADALRGKRVLEIGCGLAFDGITFAQHGARVTFADIVESNVEVVRKLCKILKLDDVGFHYVKDVESLSSLDSGYDVVLASGSLHNAPFDVMYPEAQELLRHLRVGGRWLQLAYPKSRWRREGRLPFDIWGILTDGKGTPWAEWYDVPKLFRLLAPAKFNVVLYLEFDKGNYNWFDLIRRE